MQTHCYLSYDPITAGHCATANIVGCSVLLFIVKNYGKENNQTQEPQNSGKKVKPDK